MKILFAIICLTVAFNVNAQHRYGNLLGSSHDITEGMTEKQEDAYWEGLADRLERENQEYDRQQAALKEAKVKAEYEQRVNTINYNNLVAERKPETQKKVMSFRLEQATNGSTMYRLMVSTNYLLGTDGFPTNQTLANYWLERANEK